MKQTPIEAATADFQLELFNGYANLHDAAKTLRRKAQSLLEEAVHLEDQVDIEMQALLQQVDKMELAAAEHGHDEPIDQ